MPFRLKPFSLALVLTATTLASILQAEAKQPDPPPTSNSAKNSACAISGNNGVVLFGTTNLYSVASAKNATYAWSLEGNETSAMIVGSATSSTVSVISGIQPGRFTLKVTVSLPGSVQTCSQLVQVGGSFVSAVALANPPLEITNVVPPVAYQLTNRVCFTAVDNSPVSFLKATLTNVPPGYAVTNGVYTGWCIDYWGAIDPYTLYKPIIRYSYDPDIRSDALDRVNYILNHKQGDGIDIQAAIWHFIGGPVPGNDPIYYPASAIASNIIADATANGAGFVPAPGQISAVVVDLGPGFQTNIIEILCPSNSPSICVTKSVACLLPGDQCSTFGKSATGFTSLAQSPGFCFNITVRNCGLVALTNVTVIDTELGDVTAAFFAPGTVLPPGASVNRILKMGLGQTTTNVVVASGRSVLNGNLTQASDSAVAVVKPASISCQSFVFSPDDLDGVPFDMHVQLPADNLPHAISFGIVVCNSGEADLAGVSVVVPGLAGLGCNTALPPFNLPAGACITNMVCATALTCAQLPVSLTNFMTALVSSPNGCAYDVSGTPISVSTICEAVVECTMPGACRVTGGGRQESDKTFANLSNAALVGPQARYVTHGGQVGAPVGNETAFDPDSECIHGNWTHVRHIQGGLRGSFHAKSFDSLMCACLACPDVPGSGVMINGLCNPGDRVCGPEPRRAPANKIAFSGVGNYALTSGGRVPRSVLFRVDLEDRSEPGNNKKASERPSDRYRIRIWVLSDAELARLNNPADRLLDFRKAIAATPATTATRDGADVPNGTAVFGVRAPDIDDGGEMDHGNHQIHPQIKECP